MKHARVFLPFILFFCSVGWTAEAPRWADCVVKEVQNVLSGTEYSGLKAPLKVQWYYNFESASYLYTFETTDKAGAKFTVGAHIRYSDVKKYNPSTRRLEEAVYCWLDNTLAVDNALRIEDESHQGVFWISGAGRPNSFHNRP